MTIDVRAVVLTHQPDMAALEVLVERIVPQVAGTVIVDNGSGAEERAALAKLVARYSSIRAIYLEANLGVAAGHNCGIQAALEQGCAFVLILDQDSLPAPDMVAELANGYRRAAEIKCAAVVVEYDLHAGRIVQPSTLANRRGERRPSAVGPLLLRRVGAHGVELEPVEGGDDLAEAL